MLPWSKPARNSAISHLLFCTFRARGEPFHRIHATFRRPRAKKVPESLLLLGNRYHLAKCETAVKKRYQRNVAAHVFGKPRPGLDAPPYRESVKAKAITDNGPSLLKFNGQKSVIHLMGVRELVEL